MNFRVVTWALVAIIICFAGAMAGIIYMTTVINDYQNYDYHLELDNDSVQVTSSTGDTIIHSDNLEEYFIQDNL